MLVAICTYVMRWFASAFFFFKRIGETSRFQLVKLVAFLFSVPCFKISHLFFKFTYHLNQFRLRRLCGEDFFLKFYDRRVAAGGVVDILQSLRNIESGLNGAHASKYLSDHVSSSNGKTPAPSV